MSPISSYNSYCNFFPSDLAEAVAEHIGKDELDLQQPSNSDESGFFPGGDEEERSLIVKDWVNASANWCKEHGLISNHRGGGGVNPDAGVPRDSVLLAASTAFPLRRVIWNGFVDPGSSTLGRALEQAREQFAKWQEEREKFQCQVLRDCQMEPSDLSETLKGVTLGERDILKKVVKLIPDSTESIERCFLLIKDITTTFHTIFDLKTPNNGRLDLFAFVPGVNVCVWNRKFHGIVVGFTEQEYCFHRSLLTDSDSIAHEIGHALVQGVGLERGLSPFLTTYVLPLAINEHFSDFCAIIYQHAEHNKEAFKNKASAETFTWETYWASADWCIAKGILKGTKGGLEEHSLRSMKNPGHAYVNCHAFTKTRAVPQEFHRQETARFNTQFCQKWQEGSDFQIAYFDEEAQLVADIATANPQSQENWQLQYVFSGVLNRAFYLVTKYLQQPVWEAPARIWIEALRHLPTDCDFTEFARQTVEAAKTIASNDKRDNPPLYHEAVERAWDKVLGILWKASNSEQESSPKEGSMINHPEFGLTRQEEGGLMPSTEEAPSPETSGLECIQESVTGMLERNLIQEGQRKISPNRQSTPLPHIQSYQRPQQINWRPLNPTDFRYFYLLQTPVYTQLFQPVLEITYSLVNRRIYQIPTLPAQLVFINHRIPSHIRVGYVYTRYFL